MMTCAKHTILHHIRCTWKSKKRCKNRILFAANSKRCVKMVFKNIYTSLFVDGILSTKEFIENERVCLKLEQCSCVHWWFSDIYAIKWRICEDWRVSPLRKKWISVQQVPKLAHELAKKEKVAFGTQFFFHLEFWLNVRHFWVLAQWHSSEKI